MNAADLERQRAANRAKYPEVVELLDAIERAGLGRAKVKYIGPLRDETKRALSKSAGDD